MVNIAAGKAAEMIDLTQIAPHQLPGQRLRLLLDVQRTAQRQRAAGEKTTAQLHRAKIRHPHHVTQRAASLAVGHRPAGDKPPAIGFRQQGGALVCRQPAQLKRRQPARGIVQRQRRQRIQVRRQIAVSQQARAEQPGQHQQRLSSHAHSRQLIR